MERRKISPKGKKKILSKISQDFPFYYFNYGDGIFIRLDDRFSLMSFKNIVKRQNDCQEFSSSTSDGNKQENKKKEKKKKTKRRDNIINFFVVVCSYRFVLGTFTRLSPPTHLEFRFKKLGKKRNKTSQFPAPSPFFITRLRATTTKRNIFLIGFRYADCIKSHRVQPAPNS
jgi:hypothetical protein